MSKFSCLVRFRALRGGIHYGEAGKSDSHSADSLIGRLVPVFHGKTPWDDDFVLTEELEEILEMNPGEYPTIFVKPPDALAGPFEDIPIPPICLSLDYEAELCVIIGQDCKDLKPSDKISEYILGYSAGNDVSSRWWQMPERSNHQHGVAKSFDKFAPIGPVITSTSVIPDPKKLTMKCLVNGVKRQEALIADQIFDIETLLVFLTKGKTLRKGTVIMTGTPSGVAAFLKPPKWLQDGDVVEVNVEEIGSIRNKFLFG
ncbi:Fumarylacetoacetase-like, C-terminal [Fusarium oxysporum f. sp. vasinfectum]|nr:Fumarylacetoacetase-like, C-terminal [Fusarium oxysporum f. sp. vasinfectum]